MKSTDLRRGVGGAEVIRGRGPGHYAYPWRSKPCETTEASIIGARGGDRASKAGGGTVPILGRLAGLSAHALAVSVVSTAASVQMIATVSDNTATEPPGTRCSGSEKYSNRRASDQISPSTGRVAEVEGAAPACIDSHFHPNGPPIWGNERIHPGYWPPKPGRRDNFQDGLVPRRRGGARKPGSRGGGPGLFRRHDVASGRGGGPGGKITPPGGEREAREGVPGRFTHLRGRRKPRGVDGQAELGRPSRGAPGSSTRRPRPIR